jgi:hypothetical protein
MPRRLSFFLTPSDGGEKLGNFEREGNVAYYLQNWEGESQIPCLATLQDCNEIFASKTGDRVRDVGYIIMGNKRCPVVRRVANRKRQYLMIEMSSNPSSVYLTPGGIYLERHVLRGEVATLGDDREAVALVRLFEQTYLKNFRYQHGYYLSDAAIELYKRGGRLLTMGYDEPLDYDFVPDAD